MLARPDIQDMPVGLQHALELEDMAALESKREFPKASLLDWCELILLFHLPTHAMTRGPEAASRVKRSNPVINFQNH